VDDNANDKPYEITSREPTDLGDNTPISLPEGDIPSVAPRPNADNVDRTLWFTIGGVVLFSCCGILAIFFLFTRIFQFEQNLAIPEPVFVSTPRPTSRPGPTPIADKQATQAAWNKPPISPTLGSAEDARLALESHNVKGLKSFASYLPNIPRIPQPHDIYYFGIRLDTDIPLLWDYKWCSKSAEILAQNMDQMKIKFVLNDDPVPDDFLAIKDYQEGDRMFCRSYQILIIHWPQGIHLLETNITFLELTNDGRKDFPSGTHTYQYRVSVNP
jgi:hypothetical protein